MGEKGKYKGYLHLLRCAQVVTGVECHAMFTDFTAKLLFQRL